MDLKLKGQTALITGATNYWLPWRWPRSVLDSGRSGETENISVQAD